MKLFPNMKMKYKLMFAVFLPAAILFSFIAHFLIRDYNNYLKMSNVHQMVNVAEDVGYVLNALNKEESVFQAFKINNDSNYKRQLVDAQRATDNATNALEEQVNEAAYTIGSESFSLGYRPLFNQLNQLKQNRANLLKEDITEDEIGQYYDPIQNEGLSKLNEILHSSDNQRVTNALAGFIALIELQNAARTERTNIYEILFRNKISPAHFQELLRAIGQEEGYQKTFLQLSNDAHATELSNKISNNITSEANALRNQVIENLETQNFGVDPNNWWQIKTNQIEQLNDVKQFLLEDTKTATDDIRSENMHELIFTIGLLIVTVALTLVMMLMNLRALTHRLEEEVEVLASSGQEIMNSISEASSGTAETATAVTETTTTVEELKQTGEAATEKAKNVTEVAKDALAILDRSEKSLKATIDGMNKIQEGMTTISESIIKLSEHSHAIGNIIDTVNDLAEQSHLLAVNAAIEAAKAGDQGKGFAVVAQEVRSLAEQSKAATVQVRNILNDIQNSTSAAVMATEQGSKAVQNGMTQSSEINTAISSISKGISDVVQAASQISVSSHQQLIGVEQVNVAMSNIKEASNQQVQHMRQIEISIQDLNKVGQSLKQLVQEYKI